MYCSVLANLVTMYHVSSANILQLSYGVMWDSNFTSSRTYVTMTTLPHIQELTKMTNKGLDHIWQKQCSS